MNRPPFRQARMLLYGRMKRRRHRSHLRLRKEALQLRGEDHHSKDNGAHHRESNYVKGDRTHHGEGHYGKDNGAHHGEGHYGKDNGEEY